MGNVRKSASKIHRKLSKAIDPVGYKLFGDKLTSKIEDTTAKNVWGTDVDGNAVGVDKSAYELPKIAPMPDEEELAKNRRRSSSRRRSGRGGTVLSTDGLGG